jgi:hypothetical protein
MAEFSRLAGIALIALAVCGPLAYCVAHIDASRVTGNDLALACIQAKGEWKAEGWKSPTCVFPKPSEVAQGRQEASPATSGPKN